MWRTRLHYASVDKLRELIRRLLDEDKLRGIQVFPAVGKTSGGRPAEEFWLTEAQALEVVAKSETAVAVGELAGHRVPATEDLKAAIERHHKRTSTCDVWPRPAAR